MDKPKTNQSLPKWSLAELLDDSAADAVSLALADFESKVKIVESWRSKLKADMTVDEFKLFLSDIESENIAGEKLSSYTGLKFEEDTQNQAALALMEKLNDIFTDAGNRTLFFSLWWKDLDNESAERLMQAAGTESYWLKHMRLFKPYTLSEPVEQAINLKDTTGSNALNNLYSLLTDKLEFTLEIDGEKKTMTRGELETYRHNQDPKLREAGFKEFFRVFSETGPVLAYIYSAIVRDYYNETVKLRGFSSPISVRNLGNNIPDSVIEMLLALVKKNAGVFQKYFKLKAKWLGVSKLRRYDLYAPLPMPQKEYGFEEASNLVFEVFGKFSPKMEEYARKVFTDNHIDAQVRKGKHDGAFCSTPLPQFAPWVLLNYQGNVEDVETMAHELGHAVHSQMAKEHSIHTHHSALPLAETASTFGEMLLMNALLEKESDIQVKRYLLARMIDGTYATVGRQGFFALWEIAAHKMAVQGATADEISEIYLSNLRDQFGDSLELSEDFRWEWVTIPHFYSTPFYVYAYAFGELLVYSLYKMYQTEGESFKPKYLEILSAGGSDSPGNILAKAGIDIASEKFWQGGFDAIAELVRELENLSQ